MAITYQQAINFKNSSIGSQIPYIERVLRPSNWNNLNKGLRNQYLGEIENAINDPIGFSFDRLEKDAASYLVFQNIPGGGGTAKAEAKDLKANIDKYVKYLTSNGQSVNAIMSTIDKGYVEGAKSLQEQVGRMQDEPILNKVSDVAIQVGLAAAIAPLSLPQQLAATAALQLAQGAAPPDIIRNLVATVAANSLTYGIPGVESSKVIPETISEINKKIANLAPNAVSPTTVSALINAERQALAAVITKQDVGLNAIAGAVGGTIADIAKVGFDDPLTQKTLGEYAKYSALGMSPQDAFLMAATDYAGDLAITPAAAPTGSKIGSSIASTNDVDVTVPSEIANKPEFKTTSAQVGENIIQYTDRDGKVTYRKNVTAKTPIGKNIGYTIVYDPELKQFNYDYTVTKDQISRNVTSKTKPFSIDVPTAPTDVLPPRLVGQQTGQRRPGEDIGVPTQFIDEKLVGVQAKGGKLPAIEIQGSPIQDEPTLSLIRRVRTGQETRPNVTQIDKKLPAIEVSAEKIEPEAQRPIQEPETESRRRVDEEEEPIAQRQPTDSIILDLISGGSGRKQAPIQRTPNEREAASMQALTQALSIGDPGEALFGGGLGRRRNVWNVESLRLKDELGG